MSQAGVYTPVAELAMVQCCVPKMRRQGCTPQLQSVVLAEGRERETERDTEMMRSHQVAARLYTLQLHYAQREFMLKRGRRAWRAPSHLQVSRCLENCGAYKMLETQRILCQAAWASAASAPLSPQLPREAVPTNTDLGKCMRCCSCLSAHVILRSTVNRTDAVGCDTATFLFFRRCSLIGRGTRRNSIRTSSHALDSLQQHHERR